MMNRFNHLRENEGLIILCVEVALMMMGIGLVSPILPQYARTFGVSITMVGLLITVFAVARIIVDIPAGRLTNTIGRRPILIVGPLIQVVSSIGCGLAVNYWMLLSFRFIQGIGSAMYTTAAMVMLADISTPANRGRLMSYYQGSLLLGSGLGPVLGGFIAQYLGLSAPFFAYAVFVFFAGLWAYLRLPETRPASPAQEAALAATNSNSDPAPSSTSSTRELSALLRNFDFILISIVTFGVFFMRQGAQNEILPLLGAERLGLNPGEIGLALTLVAVMQFVTIFPAGRLSDRFGRKVVITPGCLIAAASLVMLAQSYSYRFLLLTCLVMGLGIGTSGPTPSAYVADIIPRESYGIAMGTYRAISDLGFATGPVILGWLADIKDFRFALLSNSLFLFLIVLVFQLRAKEPHRHQPITVYTDRL
jgi:multidrug resistance protein